METENRYRFLTVIVMTAILGSLVLAVIDPDTRPSFADLTQIMVSVYLGFKGGQR